jgi:hypothetical protein
MPESTPPPEEFEFGQLNIETLDQVVPRLRRFTEELLVRLRACKLEVTTTTIYLLNSTDHPIEVPAFANGVQIQMNFDATLPVWAAQPRARLQVSFDHGRRYFYWEGKKRTAKFQVSRVVARFLREITFRDKRNRIDAENHRKAEQAEQLLEKLRQDLGWPSVQTPHTISIGNVKIRCLPRTPTLAIVMVVVPYDQAAEIARTYPKP